MQRIRKEDALDYHEQGRPGKIEVVPTKETNTQRDLALAYSPGVAVPCLEIKDNPEDAYRYTAKGNLVAVISNGTAVLGLGNIGAVASKPVMEGKGLLFKIFADIDVFDLELDTTDIDEFVRTVKILEPTFGGVNLEDIKAPECFEIEERLRKELNIPVMHDDQHGTAIISAAALLNALVLQEKQIEQVRFVVNGAGAAAMACVQMYVALGAAYSQFTLFDKEGVLHQGRTDLSALQQLFAVADASCTLATALEGADVFLGLSVGNVVTAAMVQSMSSRPVVFALANPDPEIDYETAMAARPDLIMATGRSDYPNQVNNVLGFPYIFRGALDVRATAINESMKLAAVKALAALAKEPVPDIVNIAYNETNLFFGPHYIIPKPIDPRLLTVVAPAVAMAAMESGVARKPVADWDVYETQLHQRLHPDDHILRAIMSKAKSKPQRVVFAEAESLKILKAAQIVRDEGIAIPILLGKEATIRSLIDKHNLPLADVKIIDPRSDEQERTRMLYGDLYFKKRQRRGHNLYEARKLMRERPWFGSMMVDAGEADVLVSGLTRNYPDMIRPALQIIGLAPGVRRVSGMYLMLTKKGPLFFSDTTVNLDPSEDDLVDIAVQTARAVEQLNIKPRIAFLSYSNFGSSNSKESVKVRNAVAKIRKLHPGLVVDGELQAGVAFNQELLKENYPFTELAEGAPNVLIFPNLAAGNIAYHLLQEVGHAEAIGPILLGLRKPVQVLQLGSTVRQIVNLVALSVLDAQ